MVDYTKVDDWEIVGDEVNLYNEEGVIIDTLYIHSLVETWISEAIKRQRKGKVI